MKAVYTPTACLWQGAPLEWLHLSIFPKKMLPSYPYLVASLFWQGRQQSKILFEIEVSNIIVPYTKEQVDQLLQAEEQWAISLSGFSGTVSYHLPKDPILQFYKEVQTIFPHRYRNQPLPPPVVHIFTNSSTNGRAAVIVESALERFN